MLLQASQPKRELGCRFELASGVSFGASSLVGFFSSYSLTSLTSRGDYHDSLFLIFQSFKRALRALKGFEGFEGFEGLRILKSKQSAVGVHIQRNMSKW